MISSPKLIIMIVSFYLISGCSTLKSNEVYISQLSVKQDLLNAIFVYEGEKEQIVSSSDLSYVHFSGYYYYATLCSPSPGCLEYIVNTFSYDVTPIFNSGFIDTCQNCVIGKTDSSLTYRGIFEVNQAKLFTKDKALLKLFYNDKVKEVKIVGYADSTGDVENNWRLARARAVSVKNYLETIDNSVPSKLLHNVETAKGSSLERKFQRRFEIEIRYE